MAGRQQEEEEDDGGGDGGGETFPCQRVFLHRLFVRPFLLCSPSPFLPPFCSLFLLLLLLTGFAVFPWRGGTPGVSQSGMGSGAEGPGMARTSPGQGKGRSWGRESWNPGTRGHEGPSHPQLRVLTILRAGECLALSSRGKLLVSLPAVSSQEAPEPPSRSSPRFWHHQLLGPGRCHLTPPVQPECPRVSPEELTPVTLTAWACWGSVSCPSAPVAASLGSLWAPWSSSGSSAGLC